MKAWFIRSYGRDVKLELGEVADPEPGPDDVLIDIRAASVNPIDWKIRDGKTKQLLRYDFPLVLGNDLSGEVVAVGSAVRDFKVGDQVFTRPSKYRIGGFAERIAVRADEVARAPANIDIVDAAGIPLVGLTAWQALVDMADVQPGQRVFVQAGAGGVGSIAIQLAKHLGAYVASTASAAKHELLRDLGADEVIDYKTQDFAEVLSDYDVVLDTLGSDTLTRALSVLKPGGIVVSVSGVPDPEFARDWKLGAMLRLGVRALSWSIRRRARKLGVRYRFLLMHESGEQLARLAELVEQGVIRPITDQRFPFEQADKALAYAEKGHATGKVLIVRAAEPADRASEASETAGEASEPASEASKTMGEASETTGEASETAAEASETTAEASETTGEASETTAEASEPASEASETTAEASETTAEASETTTETSETETDASETETEASETETEASASAPDQGSKS